MGRGIYMKQFTSCKESVESCILHKDFAIAHLYHEEKTLDIHIHDCHEIYYSISGGKQFLIDNKFYTIQPGDVFLINKYESHHLVQIDQMEHERIVISIHDELLKRLSTKDTDLNYCFSYRESNFSHCISLDKEQQQRFNYYIHKISSTSGYGGDIIEQTAFTELMVLLNGIFINRCHSNVKDISYQYNQQVDEILDYINQNIYDSITIEELAKYFFLSESYLCRIFKSTTGTTIKKYITARRISIAKKLLAEGMNVTEVCDYCGFNDYSNFLKAFSKSVGISPKKYAQYSLK